MRFSKLVRQKQLGKVVTPCFTLVSDYKQLDTRSYFITNFHTELKPQENISHDMNSPTFTLYTTMGVGRGGVEEALFAMIGLATVAGPFS